ncbi:tyrosine-type recombinase/integrase [Methanoregula sp.]|uniref:tyrosine-type recombinase/integrase n=1 Tax=Methanoregula sp. TaxID=2052170 RepID=UPI003C37C5F6
MKVTKSSGKHLIYLDSQEISHAERDIIKGFIEQRNAIKPTSFRTKGKQAYESVWICKILRENKSSLDACTVHDLLKVAGNAGSGAFTKNSRQTKIMTLKTLSQYIHRFHHPINNLDLLTHDVKAGAAECYTKKTLSMNEWKRLINTPMPARDRAIIAMLYDGYHRPKEILLLNWSDLHVNSEGVVEYEIRFKTEIPRTIVQKPWTTQILKIWARETGAKIGETNSPIFPAPDGGHYVTINVLADVFGDLKKKTGFAHLMPSVLRNSAMKHDADNGMPVSYICLRAWGVTYNKMINIYMKPDSAKIQGDQHRERGIAEVVPMLDEDSSKLTKEIEILKQERSEVLEGMSELQREMRIMKKVIAEINAQKSFGST